MSIQRLFRKDEVAFEISLFTEVQLRLVTAFRIYFLLDIDDKLKYIYN